MILYFNYPDYFAGSRHSQSLQKKSQSGFSLSQQAPSSQLHAALLFSSSHQTSWEYSGDPHLSVGGGDVSSYIDNICFEIENVLTEWKSITITYHLSFDPIQDVSCTGIYSWIIR